MPNKELSIMHEAVKNIVEYLELVPPTSYAKLILQTKLDYPISKRAYKKEMTQILKEKKEFEKNDLLELVALSNGFYTYNEFISKLNEHETKTINIYKDLSEALKKKRYPTLKELSEQAGLIKEKPLASVINGLYGYFTEPRPELPKEFITQIPDRKKWLLDNYLTVLQGSEAWTDALEEEAKFEFEFIWELTLGSFLAPPDSIGREYDIPGPRRQFSVETHFNFYAIDYLNVLSWIYFPKALNLSPHY